ncbi:TonB-dependent receptor [candidate division KSB1 bacterium]|nr:TonB-dependent receptor [candidate division KSB1 bacterium]
MKRKFILYIIGSLFIGSVAAQNRGAISGRVTDAQTGQPLPGANVLLIGTVVGAVTTLDGSFSIQNLPAGTYRLRASIVGYITFEQKNVVVESGRTTALNIRLQQTMIESGEVVVTASKRRQSIQDSPTSVGVMSSRELAQKNDVYLDKLLEHATSVNFIGTQINIRGSSGFNYGAGSRVLLLIDGVPMMPGDSGDIKWSIIPASQIDRIEIVRGAGSALYGSSAMGGVVNVITKSATSKPVTHIRLSGGIYDQPPYEEWEWTDRLRHFNDLDIDHSRRIGKGEMMLSFGQHYTTGYAQNGFYRRYNAAGKWQRPLTAHSNLTVSSQFEEGKTGTGLMWRSQRYALEVPPEAVGDYVHSGKFGLNAFHQWAVNKNFALKTRLSYFHNFWKNFFHDSRNTSRANKYGLEIQGDYQFNNLSSLTFGVEESWDHVNSMLVGRHDQHMVSAYTQYEQKLLVNLSMTAGVRFDYSWDDTTGYDDHELSPKFGMVWHALPLLSFRASSGKGFRVASMSERFPNSVYSGLRLQPNPLLKSETAWSHEAGFNLRLFPIMTLDLAGFWCDYWDLIEPVPDENNVIRFTNFTRARIAGAETNLHLQPGIKGLALQAGYTYMDPRDLDLDEVLQYRPRHILQSTLLYSRGPFEISGDYRYISRIEVVKVYPNDDRVAQKVVNLHLTYRIGDWAFSAHVNNLFNHSHTQMERTLMPIRHFTLTIAGAI